MLSKLKKPLSLFLTILLLAGPLEAVFAATMTGSSDHMVCSMDMSTDGIQSQEYASSGELDDQHHQQQCTEGQCTHSICATPAFTMASITSFSLPHSIDGKISAVGSLSVETFPASLYRPPRA